MEKGLENYKRKHCSNLNWFCNCFQLLYTRTYLLGLCREWIYLDQSFLLLFACLSNSFYLLSNSLGPSSLTHLLQIYCVKLIGPIFFYILSLDFKTCPYINLSIFPIIIEHIIIEKSPIIPYRFLYLCLPILFFI